MVDMMTFQLPPDIVVMSREKAAEHMATSTSLLSFICMHSKAINMADRA